MSAYIPHTPPARQRAQLHGLKIARDRRRAKPAQHHQLAGLVVRRWYAGLVKFSLVVIVAVLLIILGAAALTGCATRPTVAPASPQEAPTSTVTPVISQTPTKAPRPSVAPSSTPQTCTVTGGTVNVRKGPGMNYPVVTVVENGQTLTQLSGFQDGWRAVLVRSELVTGWFYVERWCK